MRGISSSGLRRKLLRSRARKLRGEREILYKYVRRISEKYPRSMVILFGSRAKGYDLPYSDYESSRGPR